ncbi:MAG: hypothetical protein ACT4OY_03015 [Alphaproteobacteria bacterium]
MTEKIAPVNVQSPNLDAREIVYRTITGKIIKIKDFQLPLHLPAPDNNRSAYILTLEKEPVGDKKKGALRYIFCYQATIENLIEDALEVLKKEANSITEHMITAKINQTKYRFYVKGSHPDISANYKKANTVGLNYSAARPEKIEPDLPYSENDFY